MKSLKALFNWVAENCNVDALFPHEWELSEDEKCFLAAHEYKIKDVQKSASFMYYDMPPLPVYTVQYIRKADGNTLNPAEIAHVEDLLRKFNAPSSSQSNSQPESSI